MLIPNADGNLEDRTPAKQGAESDAASEAREVMKQIRRLRDKSEDPAIRILADAVMRIAAYVYAGK